MQNRKLPSDWLGELKSKNDIVTTISSYISVIKKGRQYWACCPFHREKTPSFAINDEGQYYHCFGCGESGDVITFVEKMESVSTGDAIRKLAEKAGLDMPVLEDGEKIAQKKKEKDEAINALNLAKEHYIKNLYESSAKVAQEYIKKRRFKKSDLEKFQIGYSNGNLVIDFLLSKGINKETMLKSGIIGITEDGRAYDHIYNRLVFPIINTYGDCVGFSGRILENNPEKAKYKNTSQTIAFDKSSSIYGIHLLKEAKKNGQLQEIILVEGQIDVITMHSNGFNTTVASLGTAFTEKHADQLKRISDNLVLLFDGDGAGQKAALRAIELLKPFNFNLKVARMPGESDPDDFLKKNGPDKMKEIIDLAKTPIEYQLDLLKESGLNKTEDKAIYLKKALNLISPLESMSEKEVYLKIISENTRVPIDVLRRESIYALKENNEKEEKKVLINYENGNIKAIKFVILSIIKKEIYANLIFDLKNHFFNPLYKNILTAFENLNKNNRYREINDLINYLDDQEKQFVVELLEMHYEPNKDYFNDCIWNLIVTTLKMQQLILTEEYKNSNNREERLKIANELNILAKKINTKNIN